MLVYLYLKHRNNAYVPPEGKFEQLPRVTVQLPMFNEDVVAERIIRATCQIDYPLDRLEIQVLDDSTDHSADIARRAARAGPPGFPSNTSIATIASVTRPARWLRKLKQASGEFIAIFDVVK